jgi:uncharacterized damage-inducible protein DinB
MSAEGDEVPRHELLAAQPPAGYARQVGEALWRLEEGRERTLRLLAGVAPEVVDRELGGNTMGTILYHVALIETDWLFTEILEQPIPDEFETWLPVDHRDEAGTLTVVRGQPLEDHLARLAFVRSQLLVRLQGMTDDDFNRPRSLPAYDVSPAWVLHHLAQHEAEHRGEMGSIIERLRR